MVEDTRLPRSLLLLLLGVGLFQFFVFSLPGASGWNDGQVRGTSRNAKPVTLPRGSLTHDFFSANFAKEYRGPRDSDLLRRGTSPTGAETCGPGNPCGDGSCCGNNGVCGYGPTYCGNGNCTSNCDATAMCGIYSEQGNVTCGMNICCSGSGWCGTTETYCSTSTANGATPCQQGYGSCAVTPPNSCGTNSGTTNGRTIAYYQSSNVYNRACNTITPAQINTTGLTHLNFAFAEVCYAATPPKRSIADLRLQFDPESWEVVPADPRDVPMYTQFTARKSEILQTWIAIGGFDFSDPGKPTFTAWSNMTSSPTSRAAFINSLQSFMAKYGFQGVDLDWEYPGTPARGGGPNDMENYVALVKEMRAAFGTKYGISLTLAPDYWYLREFNPFSMEASVDFFGFMAYDLHGYWDAANPNLGAFVRGQTNISDISADAAPLWFDNLNPAKINFGIAYYGRGYTLSSTSCTAPGCPAAGYSKPGSCTNTPGVMSLREIQQVIQAQSLTPTLLSNAMMKQITWGNQWIGYDDAETIAMKKQWASGECFGGTMIWSIDFYSGAGSGDTPPVTTSGSCGVNNGGTICGNWTSGNCCSASGWCGSGPSYCGNGCQSGSCTAGGVTTDGTCGANYDNTICSNWTSGACCSPSGYCGSTADYCGAGCQSGPCYAQSSSPSTSPTKTPGSGIPTKSPTRSPASTVNASSAPKAASSPHSVKRGPLESWFKWW